MLRCGVLDISRWIYCRTRVETPENSADIFENGLISAVMLLSKPEQFLNAKSYSIM